MNYFAVYVINILGIIFLVANTLAVDSFYSWLIHNVACQFQILQDKIKALRSLQQVETETETETDTETNRGTEKCIRATSIRDSIVYCIKYHQQSIALAAQFNETYRPIVFAEFFFNSMQICLIVYQIRRALDMTSMPFLFSFVMAVFVQLYMYSHGGQQLENEVCFQLKLYKIHRAF